MSKLSFILVLLEDSVLQRHVANMNAPSDVTVADWYAIPYGWPGFIGYLVGLHVLVCAQNSSTPLLPTWEFRYHRFNNMLATIQAFGCAALYGLAYSMYSQLNFEGRSDLILIMLATFLNSSIKMTVLRAKASQSALTSANYKLVDSEHGGGGDNKAIPLRSSLTESGTRETSAVTAHRDRSKPSSSNLMKPHEMTIGQAIVACCIIFSPMICMMIGVRI